MYPKLILLVASLTSCLSRATHNYNPLKYSVPQPLIRAFKPKGLEVSIPHTDGVQLFAFHANINKPLDSMDRGVVHGDVAVSESERWTFRNGQVQLKIGDWVHYRLFVVKDGFGYKLQDGKFQIKILAPSNERNYPQTLATTSSPSTTPETTILPASVDKKIVLNLTQNLLVLQRETASLRKMNDILKDMLERHPDTSRTLLLDGVEVSDEDLVVIVQAIIQDRLHLPFDVTNVKRRNSGAVEFKVRGLDEKLEVVTRAMEELKHSKFVIRY